MRINGSLTEEQVTELTLSSMKKNPEGVTEYPILEFDQRALGLLSDGVSETLRYSDTKPAGGLFYRAVKRAFDIAASAIALLLLGIPMGFLALVIYLQDKGSPIFSQARLTENGKVFRMYKFRSMCVDAEARFAEVQKANETDGLAFKSENDPRITKIGRFIRKTSIDELPQLWNILKGDMSIIGPRPPLPREVVLYTPHQMERLMVKGGLSCICQVEGRSDMEFDKWVESDIQYVKTRSLGLDLKLLFKTIGVVILKKGAR
ncbi:sugar transferase [uncultured Ruminococcus sp.]|uniref:sugar transferase n=1 Tax=uncultured Ruminococcus sp. TaxID=165186 RepID=UPI00261A4BDE|nr:sugar transferase [uncultured Ruminococcus sp.]